MAYVDAWYVGGATLEHVDACFCASVRSIPAVLARGDMIAATTWSWLGVAAALRPLALIDTRPMSAAGPSQGRPREQGEAEARSARLRAWTAADTQSPRSPTWCNEAARNSAPSGGSAAAKPQASGDQTSEPDALPHTCDTAVAMTVRTTRTAGERAHVTIAVDAPTHGGTAAAPRVEQYVVDARAAAPRVDAPLAGRFRTRCEIAERVAAGERLGDLGRAAVIAPASGVLRALCARGARVAEGQTLVEIETSGDPQRCFGIEPPVRAIAQRVVAALRQALVIGPSAVPVRSPEPRDTEADSSVVATTSPRLAARALSA